MEWYPKISVVTTNYNGAAYLEAAIRSVLDQGYPNLEYIVIDGGSSDESQEIIVKYEKYLSYWESERDRGFAHAYNKGFAIATGDIFAFLNSDDMYCPWAFETVARCFRDLPEIEWLTTLFPMLHSEESRFVSLSPAKPYNRELYYAGFYGATLPWVQQESTFWRRELWEKSGGYLNEGLKLAIDAELWARFFEWSELYAVTAPLGGFRVRPGSKSASDLDGYFDEVSTILAKYGERTSIGWLIRPSIINRLTRRLLNLPKSILVNSLQFTGKIVSWDFNLHKYVPCEARVFF